MDRFVTQLALLPDVVKAANTDYHLRVRKVTSIDTMCEIFNTCIFPKTMLSDVDRLIRIYLTIPLTSVTAERSFSPSNNEITSFFIYRFAAPLKSISFRLLCSDNDPSNFIICRFRHFKQFFSLQNSVPFKPISTVFHFLNLFPNLFQLALILLLPPQSSRFRCN